MRNVAKYVQRKGRVRISSTQESNKLIDLTPKKTAAEEEAVEEGPRARAPARGPEHGDRMRSRPPVALAALPLTSRPARGRRMRGLISSCARL